MHSEVSLSAWLMWMGVTSGQLLVIARAQKTERRLAAYLGIQVAASLIGMVFARFASAPAYFHAFVVASCIADVSTLSLTVYLLDEFRLRARPHKQSRTVLISVSLAVLLVTVLLSHLPLPNLSRSPWMFTYSSLHLVWTWMAMMIAIIPVYCCFSGADANLRLWLLTAGLATHVFIQAGTADFLIDHNFAHAALVHQLETWAYFLALGLWFTAARTTQPQHHPVTTPLEATT